ncbi:hypothetical protein ACHAXS_008022 [Conticribra weissflogii]
MTAVGNCVAGLSDIESLIPSLRSLGRTHRMAGVDEIHYKKLFRHLSDAIKEKIGINFDDETAEAWELVYFSLSSIMYHNEVPLDAEAVSGWHEVILIASIYLIIATPFQVAEFSSRVGWVETLWRAFNAISLVIFIADLASDHVVDALRVKPEWKSTKSSVLLRKEKSILSQRFGTAIISAKAYARRKVRLLAIDQWVSWPTVDKLVIAGFSFEIIASKSKGMHWMQMLGLLRVTAVVRVVHAAKCIENRMLLRQCTDQHFRTVIRIAKLAAILAYVTHVSGCLWFIVARIEIGMSTTEALPTDFFPQLSLLNGHVGMINSYILALHWAFVNLAGIGNVESTPVTILETVTTLMVHAVGVTFYAIFTGNIVGILEEYTNRDNRMSDDLDSISSFMNECRIPRDVRERIMQGYLMRNMIGNTSPREEGGDESLGGAHVPSISNDILSRLPRHLRRELKVYERAEALRRRGTSFRYCSDDFLFALCGELGGSHILLPGDYLVHKGEIPHQVVVVDSGTLEVENDGKTVMIFRKGDLLGKPWLLRDESRAAVERTSCEMLRLVSHPPRGNTTFSEWLDNCGGFHDVTVRAMSEVRLGTGLSLPHDVYALKKRFPEDFEALRRDRDRVIAAAQRVNITRNVVKARMAFKRKIQRTKSA